MAKQSGAYDAVICNHWALGGKGAADLAQSVIKASEQKSADFKFLYPLEVRNKLLPSTQLILWVFSLYWCLSQLSLEEKIETISREIYGADGIELSDEAKKKLDLYTKQVHV